MLAEVGGLGFIGLFLSTIVTGGPLGQIISSLSSNYLNDDELLLETFEFLHTFFFQVGILFFAIAGIVVGAVLKDVQSLSTISELALDTDGDGEVSLDELADALQVDSMIVDLDGDGIITPEELTEAIRSKSTNINSFTSTFINEWNKNDIDYASENLVVRQRMMDKFQLPSTFKIEDYFAQIFGHNLEEVVELSPVTWLPLIPLIAVDNSVDLSRDVVSAASSNAFDSAGYFYATPWVLYSTILLQIISLVWSTFNYWKLSAIKEMLLPTLVKEHEGSEAILLPPRYEDKVLLNKFNSSPSFFEWGEQFFTGGGSKVNPPTNDHEKLYGAMGSKLPSIMRDSIQFHTWLSVALIVYSTTQIIFRDATALYLNANVGDPDTVVQELVLWSVFVASTIFQLSLAPTTFLNYCFVTSIEEFVKEDVVKKSIVFEDMDLDKLWKRSVVSTSTIDEEKIEEVLVEEVFELTEGETTLLNGDDVTAEEEDTEDGGIESEEEDVVVKDELDRNGGEVEEDAVVIEDTNSKAIEDTDNKEVEDCVVKEDDAAEEYVSINDSSKRSKVRSK